MAPSRAKRRGVDGSRNAGLVHEDMRKIWLRLTLALAFMLSPQAQLAVASPIETDPLFTRLAGSWLGEGETVFPMTGKRIILSSRVTAILRVDGRLRLRDHVIEKPATPIADPTEPKESIRLFWIRAKANPGTNEEVPRYYELGTGSGEAGLRPSAEGVFEKLSFRVSQTVGGNSSYRVESETEFLSQDEHQFFERVWHGGELGVETRIRYHRVADAYLNPL